MCHTLTKYQAKKTKTPGGFRGRFAEAPRKGGPVLQASAHTKHSQNLVVSLGWLFGLNET